MKTETGRRPGRADGQIIVILVGGLVAMLAMVALIVDGGNAYSHQRAVQNGSDAAANAGALVLAQNVGVTPTKTDGDVNTAVQGSAAANKLGTAVAYYTNVAGDLLRSDGTPTTDPASAVLVGSGSIPPCLDTNTCVAGSASGVRVYAHRDVGTYIARVVGINQIGVSTAATAVAGYLQGACDNSAGCNVLPVTIPVTVVTCDASNNPVPAIPTTEYAITDPPTRYVIPLCQNSPGNVGWLDWTPTAGGTSELITAIEDSTNPPISVPSWQYVTSTGNVNSAGVEDALNEYAGQVVLIPQFDGTCDAQPAGTAWGDCPPANQGGNGSNQWYHVQQFAGFKLDYPKAAYVNGSNADPCDTGNGATACIVGTFVHFITAGTVGPGVGAGGGSDFAAVGVQLVR